MRNEIKLGKFAGLALSAQPSAIFGSLFIWILLAGLAWALLKAPLGIAILGGLLAILLHWISDLVHHLGHAFAARRTGYPMSGVRFWGVLGTSLYPPDEPELPGALHIRRALGGPSSSLLFTLLAGVVALAVRPLGGVSWWLAAFVFLDNLLVFTLGAISPMGFTDGSTILRWRGKR